MLSAPALDALCRELERGRPELAALDQVRPRAVRRARGQFFTPAPLARLVAEEVIAARLAAGVRWRRDGSPALVVLDPAAGDGRFLVAAADALVEHAARAGFAAVRARRAITARCLVGVERDAELAAAARVRLPGARVEVGEALLGTLALPPADVVLGNPPYVRSIRLGQGDAALRDSLRGRFAATSHGEWDLYAAFLERALAMCGPLGEVGLVVPSRWLTARFAGPLRQLLADRRALRAVVEFGAAQLFPGATTYAALVFLSRTPQREVHVARRSRRGFELGTVGAASLGPAPWRLSIGRGRSCVDALAAAGPPLAELARVAKGTGTNADPAFLVPAAHGLEPDLIHPCVRGRDVLPYGLAADAPHLVVPYRDGVLVSPAALRALPRTRRHLEWHRARLEAREGGRFRGETFYRFGRPQNLEFLADPAPKIVVPDVARAGRAVLDARGMMVLDTAYAVRPHRRDDELSALLLAICNSRAIALWLVETGVPLRGGYLRLKTASLGSLPIPRRSRATGAIVAAVRRGAAADRIDELVRRAYGLSERAWTAAEPRPGRGA